MKNRIYINGIGAVTAQGVWRSSFFDEAEELQRPISRAQQPIYKELISPAMLRRMSTGIKMGIYAGQQALDEAEVAMPDAIITGTGLGCSEDSEKFLRNILDNEEEFLTPTSFIQSTHNTVAAQIALRLGCKGYNFTYVNRSVSFESALLDGLLQIQTAEAAHVLVGGVDEASDHTYHLLQLIGQIKQNESSERVKESITAGANYAEGATFFTLAATKTASSYAELLDVRLHNELAKTEMPAFVTGFLEDNALSAADIDLLVLGYNGDVPSDVYYKAIENCFEQVSVSYYKHLIGQFDSSSAFGLATGAAILRQQQLADTIRWNEQVPEGEIKTIVIYNQFQGKDHSLILLKRC